MREANNASPVESPDSGSDTVQPTVAFATVGCRLNQAETDGMAEQFTQRGWTVGRFTDGADLFYINTCTVTGRADRASRKLIHRARRENPNAVILAVGCFAGRAADELVEEGEVDAVLGVEEKAFVFDYLPALDLNLNDNHLPSRSKTPLVEVSGKQNRVLASVGTRVSGRSRAFLKVQDGCDHQCAYCAVTLVRGSSRSVAPDQVRAALQRIKLSGFEEVVLTGVDLAAWGKDLGIKLDFVDLVRMADDEGLPRIRLSSLEPWELTPERARKLADVEAWCEHLHLSLQTADPELLTLMGREMDIDRLIETLAVLRENRPQLTIGADVIAGLPGETESAHRRTLAFLDTAPLHYLHVFPYSPRPGTIAAQMTPQIDFETIHNRASRLREEGRRRKRAHLQSAVGSIAEVLVEENGRNGYTRNYLRVQLTEPAPPRHRTKVRLLEIQADEDIVLAEGLKHE